MQLIVLLALLTPTLALTEIDQQCIANNDDQLANSRLLGTWYLMYTFSIFGGLLPSTNCINITISEATAADVQEYKEKYQAPDLPYSFEDSPVLWSLDGLENGMLFGNKQAKFFVLKPDDGFGNPVGYEVQAYQFLTEKFLMYSPCMWRGNRRQLLSSDRHATVEEMEQVIRNTRELNLLERNRFCA